MFDRERTCDEGLAVDPGLGGNRGATSSSKENVDW